MRVFKNSWFSRFTAKEDISDSELIKIVNQLELGQADADLGGSVYKVRIARPGKGKSGGYRVIVFFKSQNKTFYHYAYPKSVLGNITEKELLFFKKLSLFQNSVSFEKGFRKTA